MIASFGWMSAKLKHTHTQALLGVVVGTILPLFFEINALMMLISSKKYSSRRRKEKKIHQKSVEKLKRKWIFLKG